ncbi:sulfatase-like hydrolase/transferase [Urbifossiella limnaea]|uniref:Sulfatase n=1 Tax=Urbifossiella limnaea TaxID=2528023 RepID=A0A517XT12_9BACT|nr:sulfatase-like hydrolase/transferase [Urbifossiella limnaea]QDU20625.1 Sulfatase [Urbifossiella limnaea]
MSVIVFAARGLPAWWLGPYGNEWVVTPTLDRLAAEGVTFDRHLSDCPDPDAAGRAWLSGRQQVPPMDGNTGLTPEARPVLLETLAEAGVRTVLVRANYPDTDGPPSYYAGWAEVFDARPDADDASPLDALLRELPGVLDRLPADGRWLLWVDTDRCVPPWDVPQDVFDAYLDDGAETEAPDDAEPVSPFADPPTGLFDRSDPSALDFLHRTFAAVVTKLDDELGRAFEAFRSRGLDRTAAWLITSDRGYPLGEHGQVGPHRPWLHQTVVQVPLLLRLPGAQEAGRRVGVLTQPADLTATLLSLFGARVEPGDGFDLLPLASGGEGRVRPEAVSGWVVNGVGEWALHTADRTLLLPGPQPHGEERPVQLYVKPEDRWEANDVRAAFLDQADEMEARLHSATRSPPV